MNTYLYRASNLKSTIIFLFPVSWRKLISGAHKKVVSCDLFIIIILIIIIFIVNFFRRVFSEYTEASK